MSKSTLKRILVVDTNPGNIAAAQYENISIARYGYTFITATTLEEANKLLVPNRIFGLITESDLKKPGEGRILALRALTTIRMRSIILIEESSMQHPTVWAQGREMLEGIGINVSTHSGCHAGIRWSPSKQRLVQGDYSIYEPEMPWKTSSGETIPDLQQVRSWSGQILGAPLKNGSQDVFPGFPRDGDYEISKAVQESLG